jgi:hypothetical protein
MSSNDCSFPTSHFCFSSVIKDLHLRQTVLHHIIFSTVSFLSFNAVLWIRDILVRIRMRIRNLGSVPLSNGCGSVRPKTILIVYIRMRIRNTDKNSKSQQLKTRFLLFFGLMMEGSGAGSVLVTNGCGSGRPENCFYVQQNFSDFNL